ncbi:hypothetical protein SAMN05428959_10277 [Duganella sp. CF517]|uniref:hypothetical protein n=1 Tax=Duganella sp. CF517 TaxID=1881038 RepID=UPI0008CC2A35|nr:hypothetical protein [Duganella sp. CF517]SEN48312.1 hypothetical protein SAMN05428959_10277 [Duganella sp. CF517]
MPAAPPAAAGNAPIEPAMPAVRAARVAGGPHGAPQPAPARPSNPHPTWHAGRAHRLMSAIPQKKMPFSLD